MPQHLVWLFGRAGIPVMEANDGNGNDLGGGNADNQSGNDNGGQDKTPENKPGQNQQGSDGEGDDAADKNAHKTALNDEAAKLLKDVMKHKDRAKNLESELNSLKTVLGDLKPEDVAKLVSQQKEQERLALEKRGEYDRIMEQVRQEHTREKGTLSEQIEALRAELNAKDQRIEEMTVGRSFSESAFIREKSKLPPSIARKEFGTHVDLVDGQVVVFDKPRGAAERTPLVDANGSYKSFEEAIAQLYASHPDSKDLIKAQGKPGAGSGNQDTGKKPTEPQKAQVTGVNRIASAIAAKSKG